MAQSADDFLDAKPSADDFLDGKSAKTAPFKPLTFGNTLGGAAELAGSAVANIPGAAVNGALDLYRLMRGKPQTPGPIPTVPVGSAGNNLLEGIGNFPGVPSVDPNSYKSGYTYVPQTIAQNIANLTGGLKGFTQGNGVGQAVLRPVVRAAGDVAKIYPAASIGKDLAEGIAGRIGEGKPPAAPTKEQLGEQATAAYQKADQAGVVVKPQALQTLQKNLAGELQKQGIDPTLHPAATAALKRVTETTGPQTFQQLETLRRIGLDAEATPNVADARLAGKVVDHIDDFMENLKPSDVASGNSREAAQALVDARNLYARKKKADIIDNLMDRARLQASQFSGSGLENAVRTQFRQLAMNQKRLRSFTPDEQAAIKNVATGGSLENGLRMLGKFAPTGGVSTATAAFVGGLLGGPVGAASLAGGGLAARQLATALTLRNAAKVGELVRRGPGMRVLPEARPASIPLVNGPLAANVTKLRAKIPAMKAESPLTPEIAALLKKAGREQATPEEKQRLIDAGYAGSNEDFDFILYPRGRAAAQ